MDLALNNQQRLICHKTQPTNQREDVYNLVKKNISFALWLKNINIVLNRIFCVYNLVKKEVM